MSENKILIIDDDAKAISFIIDSLEEDNPNYIFYHGINGLAGIEAAKKHLPDLILTDWEMPGLSGIETIKGLKSDEATRDIPIIMVTGVMLQSSDLATSLHAGAIDFIRKPVDKVELQARTRSMLMLAKYYRETLSMKDRELTSTTMSIFQNNEFYGKVINQLTVLKDEIKGNTKAEDITNNLHSEISQKIKGDPFKQFEKYFNKVNPSFFKELAIAYPNLTPSELKLAAFVRLNLSSKEIAGILFSSPQSIKTARYRLRKKLGIGRDENLTNYLHQY